MTYRVDITKYHTQTAFEENTINEDNNSGKQKDTLNSRSQQNYISLKLKVEIHNDCGVCASWCV